MNRRALGIIGAIAVAALAAAFWFVDFHAAASDTRAGLQLVTLRSDPPADTSVPNATLMPPVAVCVAGDADFAAGFRTALERELRAVGIGASTDCPADAEPAGGPVLSVRIAADGTTWTPVYSTGQLIADAAYASDGDLSWLEKQPVVMPSGVRAIRADGNVTVDDATRGLISRPAYRRHLGEAAGAELGRTLARTLSDMQATATTP